MLRTYATYSNIIHYVCLMRTILNTLFKIKPMNHNNILLYQQASFISQTTRDVLMSLNFSGRYRRKSNLLCLVCDFATRPLWGVWRLSHRSLSDIRGIVVCNYIYQAQVPHFQCKILRFYCKCIMTCSRSGPCLNFLVLAIKWLGFSLKSDKHRGNRNAHKKQTKYECCTTVINELRDTFYMRYFSMSSFELGSI